MLFQRLTSVANNAYAEEDWHIMASAFGIASFLLQRSIGIDRNAGRLAREIMRLFNTGLRDVNKIATLAADRERLMG
ncbi:MAG: hypothetical protein AAAB35_11695 [Phyllobacterium sp.]|uniref:hypothetical protein n=1 Tax=Phyllobacterium sp. TaxID=1871046 RepID=UPI0030EFC1B3